MDQTINDHPQVKERSTDLPRKSGGRSEFWDPVLLSALLLFCLAAFVLGPFYTYRIGPDSIVYFSMAKLCYAGHGDLTITSHWSPLLSWILAPFLGLNIAPEAAIRLTAIPLGIVAIGSVWKLGALIGIPLRYRRISLIAFCPIMLLWGLECFTPDFIALALVLPLWTIFLHPEFGRNPRLHVWAGVFGGAGYLCRSYFFPYFLAAYLVMMVRLFLASPQRVKPLAVCLVQGLIPFLLIAIPWAATISLKEGRPTIGSAGSFTIQYQAPGYPNVALEQGFVPPPHDKAVSFWEDPTKLTTKNWRPFNSVPDFTHYLSALYRNFFGALQIINSVSCTAVGLVLLSLLITVGRNTKKCFSNAPPAVTLAVLAGIYASGFILIFIEGRYFWPVSLTAILLGFFAVQQIEEAGLCGRRMALLICAIIAGSCFIPSGHTMGALKGYGKPLHTMSLAYPEIEGRRVAADDVISGLNFAYYGDAKFYGAPLGSMTKAEILENFKTHQINYFLLAKTDIPPAYLDGWDRIDTGEFHPFSLYRAASPSQPQESANIRSVSP